MKFLVLLMLIFTLTLTACETETEEINVFEGEEILVETLYENENFVIGTQEHNGEKYFLFNTEEGYQFVHEDDLTVIKSEDTVKLYRVENGYVFNWPRGTHVHPNYKQ